MYECFKISCSSTDHSEQYLLWSVVSATSPRPSDHLRVARFLTSGTPHAVVCGCGNKAVQSMNSIPARYFLVAILCLAVRDLQLINS